MIFELVTLQTQRHAATYNYSVRITKLDETKCDVDIYELRDGVRQDVLFYVLEADELHGRGSITFRLINGETRVKTFSLDFSDQIFQVVGLIRGILERVHQFRKEN